MNGKKLGKKLLSILVLLLGSAFADESQPTLTIEVINHPNTRERSIRHIYIRRQGGHLLCRTNDIPEHRVKIPGFSFRPPFKNERQQEPNCLKAIRWDNSQTCYKAGRNRTLDELFRQCFGF